jgi:cell division septum initiation protein DivIVA
VPRMGSFKRALLGYRRDEVDAAVAASDDRIEALAREAEDAEARASIAGEAVERAEREQSSLAEMVIEREREIRGLGERLREANERHDRSIASLESVSARLEDVQQQARGQATRIRMKALREAVEVSRRTQELAAAHDDAEGDSPSAENGASPEAPAQNAEQALGELFEGLIKLEIGPLGDFSQLVGFEDAVGRMGASEISVERFSEGRATLSMQFDEPVALLRELEESAPFDFEIRRTSGDELVLDVDEDDAPGQQAA